MTPEEIDELLGAYALDAVSDDEREAVEAYLVDHPRARAEVREHREVATMLAFTGAPAPAGLWDRIAGSIDGDAAPEPGPALAEVLELPRRTAEHRVGSSPARRRSPWMVWAAGAVAAAVIALLGVTVVRQNQRIDQIESAGPSDPMADALARALADPATRSAELRSTDAALRARAVIAPNGTGFLVGSSLPALSDDRSYQLWGVVGGRAISLGLLGPHPGVSPFKVNGDVKALAVTDELAGGVVITQQQPVVQGALT